MTSEYLGTSLVRGRSVRVWKETGPNHLLDCRIYAMAMAEMLGLTRMTEAQWAELARYRGMPADAIAADLFAPAPLRVAEAVAAKAAAAPEATATPADAPAINGRTSGWWSRR